MGLAIHAYIGLAWGVNVMAVLWSVWVSGPGSRLPDAHRRAGFGAEPDLQRSVRLMGRADGGVRHRVRDRVRRGWKKVGPKTHTSIHARKSYIGAISNDIR